MKAIERLAIGVCVYLVLVVAVESLVGFMGRRQAERGVQPGEDWLVLTTTDAEGARRDTVVAGVESEGHLYVSANHWPRGWYHRALASPEVEVVRGGARAAYRAVPVTGHELTRIVQDYPLPWAIRFLTGFPPRSFLRLDPR
jgi:hypothetical protein